MAAAKTTKTNPRIRIGGPVRLLCFHAVDPFLKSFLRRRGQDIDTLRAYGHRLSDVANVAQDCGLTLSASAKAKLETLTERNDYVRVRYVVVGVL